MLLSIIYVLTSLLLFYYGALWLVKGSSSLALKAGVSPLVAGLTVVAFGSSSPELVVSINSVLTGHGNIAIGNLIGSNLFNIFMILGISAIISPLKIKIKLLKIDISVLIISTIVFMLMFTDRQINRFEGGILVLGIILYTTLNFIFARRDKSAEVKATFEQSIADQKMKWYGFAGMVIFGITLLIAGSRLLLKGVLTIADSLGVGETIISITIIAACTSMPLLASAIVATKKKEYDIAVGTVIGSGIFNVLAVLGISSIIRPLSAIAISNIDLYVMIGATLLLLQFFRTKYALKRDDGIFMIGLYLIYMYYLWPK